MAHTHKIQRFKDGVDFDGDGGYVVALNVAGRPISVGPDAIKLYPGEKVFICDDNPVVEKLVASKKVKIVDSGAAKPKTKNF